MKKDYLLSEIENIIKKNIPKVKFFGQEKPNEGPWEKTKVDLFKNDLAFKSNKEILAFVLNKQYDNFIYLSTCYMQEDEEEKMCGSIILNMETEEFESTDTIEKLHILDSLIEIRDDISNLMESFYCFEEYIMPYEYTNNLIQNYINILKETYSQKDLRSLLKLFITNFYRYYDDENIEYEFKELNV